MKAYLPEDKDRFFRAYVRAALWSSTDNSTDNGGDPLDDNYDQDDIAEESQRKMRRDCEDFIRGQASLLVDLDAGQCGHDFWLTRNGHGTGFWDRGLGTLGEKLSKAAKAYGTQDLYIGDDGKIYIT